MPKSRVPGPLGYRSVIPTRKVVTNDDVEFIGDIDGLTDGSVRLYDVSDYATFFLTERGARRQSRPKRTTSYPVLYVNGMQGSPAKFRAQACCVAALSGGPVWGVYNGSGTHRFHGDNAGAASMAGDKPGNMLWDLLECTTDKLQSTDLDQFKVWFKQKTGVPQSQIEAEMVQNLSQWNRAAGALLTKLLEPGFENARIVAHSQGNIITCNAVNAVAALRGNKAISKMRIEAIASPVVFWSEAGMFGQNIVCLHALANDLIAWIGANITDRPFLFLREPVARDGKLAGTEVSEGYQEWSFRTPHHALTHNFYAYLEKMWEELRSEFD